MDRPTMNMRSKTVISMGFHNAQSLSTDLQIMSEMPEMCDVKFLVGKHKSPVYGVKSILCTRNRILCSIILAQGRVNAKQMKKRKRLGYRLQLFLHKLTNPTKPGSTKPSSKHLTIEMLEFEPATFKKMIEFLMTGNTSVNVHTVIGVMISSHRFGIADLREACYKYAQTFIHTESVLSLLKSCQMYEDFGLVRKLRNKMLMFIADHAEDVLQQKEFTSLAADTMAVILAQSNLNASKITKEAAIHLREATLKECRRSVHMDFNTNFSESADLAPITIDDLINQAEILQAVAKVITENDSSVEPVTNENNKGYQSVFDITCDSQRLKQCFTPRTKKDRTQSTFVSPDVLSLDIAFMCSSDEESQYFS